MPETDPAPVMEETAVANGGGGGGAAAAAAEKDMTNKEETPQSKDTAVENEKTEEQNKASENGTEGPSDGDVKMAEAENAKEVDGDASEAKQVDSSDVKMDGAENADAKEDNNAKTAEGEDVKMTEAETGNTEVKNEQQKDDKDENTDVDKQDPKKQENDGLADQEESKGKETDAVDKQEEDEAEEKHSAEEKEENTVENEAKASEEKQEKDGADYQGKEREETEEKEENIVEDDAKASEEKQEKDGADDEGKDREETEENVTEADKKLEDNKEETPKNKKARSARDRSQGKDGSRSREAKSLLSTPSPYGTDRPQRERKTVERLVEVIEKEPNSNFVVEKGRGTPLKDIPSVAHRISRKKPTDLKFLHSILFGKKGKTADFKGHILQFSGFVWHESDEKMRAKAKEKLDKCVKDILLDLCWLLAIPVPKSNIRKEDIVSKLLDFIAEPHGVTDSGFSDDQGSNSRKRKRGGSASKTPDTTPNKSRKKLGDDTSGGKGRKKALKYDTDEDEDDESMKSDSERDKDEDTDEAADEQEDDYDSEKQKGNKKSSETSGKKKTEKGSGHKTGPPRTISKHSVKKSSSKISKEKGSLDDSTKVFSRKRKHTPKGALVSEKDTKDKKASGRKVTKGKGESADVDLPSKDELKKTIAGILKKVDFNTATFSDILKKLDNHYKMDLTPKKEAIKLMIQDELTRLSEADEEEHEKEDAQKKQRQHQAKEVEA
ncbi:hypothetical protein ACP4OV_008753 [Aristida adscensionis]